MEKSDYLTPRFFLKEIGIYLYLIKVQYLENYYDCIWMRTQSGYKCSYYYIEPNSCIVNEDNGLSSKSPNLNGYIEIPSNIAEPLIKTFHNFDEQITWNIGHITTTKESDCYIYPVLEPNKLQPRPLYLYMKSECPNPCLGLMNNRAVEQYECIELGNGFNMGIYQSNCIHKLAEPIPKEFYYKIRRLILTITSKMYSILSEFYNSQV